MELRIGSAGGAGWPKRRDVAARAAPTTWRESGGGVIVVLEGMLLLLLVDGARGDDLGIWIIGIVRHWISTNHLDMYHIADVHTLEQRHDVLMRPA